ncbi:hypothetical protein OHS58_29500 [Amycolatopsis sp. NBC_00348]|uniref:effector-associated domain 2-containing protein n=1 Tax=Amycolatopsis sp. NBC_00348 TaxID=2975956 RepID=UPI002E25EEC1
MAVDIAGYNDPKRAMIHRRAVHEGFWGLMRRSFADAGIPWDVCFVENTGDGAMIQLPAQVAKADLVAGLPDRMLAELRRYNEVRADAAGIRLRVAIHAGEVYEGSHGTVSDATSFAFRLLDEQQVKSALKSSGAQLALIVSDTFFQDVVRADPAADPGSYRRIAVSVKETHTEAWLRLLGTLVKGYAAAAAGSELALKVDFPALVDALLAVPCVRDIEGRRLLLEQLPRREIADAVPYHPEDRLHVIALARTCQRFDSGLSDLLAAVRTLEPESPQVRELAKIIGGLPGGIG